MISRGIVFAGRKALVKTGKGHIVYKAENIVTGEIYGDPQDEKIDISAARNRYLFDALPILPKRMWAVARIERCPNAVSFNPKTIAFTDTATIFGPRENLSDFPFDLLFLSRIYRYYYVLACRMSFLNLYRGDIYPANIRLLPWADSLAARSKDIEALRVSLVDACQTAYRTSESMFGQLSRVKSTTFREAVRGVPDAKVLWSESFTRGAEKIEVAEAPSIIAGEDGVRLLVSGHLFDWVEISHASIAERLRVALLAYVGTSFDREELLTIAIPLDAAACEEYAKIVAEHHAADLEAPIEKVVDLIDSIVGSCLGLSEDEISAIRRDMTEDAFLSNIKPRYPMTSTRLHGYRTGLDSSERYG